MSAYSELKADFDHLKKRTWQLFEYGIKREHILTETLASAWKQFERIRESKDANEIRQLATSAMGYLADVLSEQTKESGE